MYRCCVCEGRIDPEQMGNVLGLPAHPDCETED